jgi:hypothetical protein
VAGAVLKAIAHIVSFRRSLIVHLTNTGARRHSRTSSPSLMASADRPPRQLHLPDEVEPRNR